MATVQRFEDLLVWQKARLLTKEIYQHFNIDTLRCLKMPADHGLCDQIQRASVSVMSNIAEGFERGTKQEFLNYLYIAKGSCGEVRAQLYVAYDAKYLSIERFKDLNMLCEEVSRLLSSFIAKVKGSAYRGLQYKKRQRSAEERGFDERLSEMLEKSGK